MDEEELLETLTKAIDDWWDRTAESTVGRELPYIGEDVMELMATAALAVLSGIANTQRYLENNNLLREG